MFVFFLASWHIALVVAIKNEAGVKVLVEKTIEVMTACSAKVTDAPDSREALLKCTAVEQAKTSRVFPKDLFEVMHDKSGIWKEVKQTRQDFWKSMNPAKGAKLAASASSKAKEVIYATLERLPPEILTPAGIKKPFAEMERLQKAGKKFSDLFPERFTELKVLGDGNNKQGIAYLVEDNDPGAVEKEAVLKVLTRPADNTPQKEFEIQKILDGMDWQHIKDYDEKGVEKVTAAKEKFIPHVLTDDKSKDAEHVFDYIVMERAGITIEEWMNLPTKDTRRPSNGELVQVLSRSYSILKAIHSAGYRHGDNNSKNWALSRNNQKVLFLFDFGRAKQMTDFTWIATDWYRWVRLLEHFAEMISSDRIDPEKPKVPMKQVLKDGFLKMIRCGGGEDCPEETPKELKARLDFLAKQLMVELGKILWFHPDVKAQNTPFQELVAPKYKDTFGMEGFKQFRAIAEGFLGMLDSPVDVSTTLYRWKPRPGERRRREVQHPTSLLVVEMDALNGITSSD